MSVFDQIKMENCRLCHCNSGETKICSDKKLSHEILDCVDIQIQDDYAHLLPNKICGNCRDMIKNFYTFKHHIREVDDCLRNILSLKIEDTETQTLNLKCEQCPATFQNNTEYDAHMQSHSLSKYCCGKSSQREPNSKSYSRLKNKKINNCSSEDASRTEVDDIKIESSVDIKNDLPLICRNEIANQSKSQFACPRINCGKICKSATSLKTHELKHDDERCFLCVTCGKSFLTKNSLTCHEKIHLEVKGYSCEVCNIGFSVRSNLRAHEKKYHEGIRFYCSKCTKDFVTKCSLERHERMHTGIRDFQCESCPSAFYTNKELVKHQRYHQGLRLHKCEQCFKAFFERHHLIIHLRSHTGERPYVCKISGCGKAFTESQKLKRHHNAKHPHTT